MSVQQKAGVVLPAACAVAASFDPALARSVGAAQGQTEVDPNIKRSPLCGRNFAMFSEDPHLTAALAAAVVGGAQNAVVGPLLCCSQVTDAPDRRVDERTLQEIYLPPAALSDRPPALPVMELLAGQPGSPSRLIDAGNIAATMNAYAAKHDGLAPIVLVPDQNGEATHNSLCADTTQGNAETYLTTDVVNWAKKMLPVAKSARMWAMGGFSQGGTCTTQLVPRHPDIYGAMLPVDGELKPTNGSVAKMVQEYFAGDRKAYDEQVPVNAIAATGTPEQALFTGAGERDKESISNMRTIADAARKAGMEVTELIVPGTGHDWHAVQAVWRPGLDWFGERTGLGEMTKSLKEYPQVEVLQ